MRMASVSVPCRRSGPANVKARCRPAKRRKYLNREVFVTGKAIELLKPERSDGFMKGI